MTGIDVETFENERTRLFGLAYRMCGSVADADDIVQDAWLRARTATDIDRPAAWLTTVVTRLTIDRLRAAARRQEQYVGPWLPEPILTDRDPAHVVETDETLTLSFLHVLDRLEPVERAVFLLREVFGADYDDVADVVGRSPDTCRQINHRARQRVRSERPRFDVDPERRQALLDSFLVAVLDGDAEQLEALLAEDVLLVSDGGPSRRAARHPIAGRQRVGRFVANLAKRIPADAEVVVVEANGAPAIVLVTADDVILVVPEFDGTLLRRIEVIVAPEKLGAVCAAMGGDRRDR